MSVIVKGMSVPGSCNKCQFSFNGWCWAFHKKANGREMSNRVRADWCPLRPLPEKHGRLIDADALDETFSRLNDDGWQLTRGDHKRMESVLFEMPTIVEAEGE